MPHDFSFNNALVGFYRSVAFVSALVFPLFAVAGGPVSVDVSPTTSHYSLKSDSIRPPAGTTVAPTSASPPVVSRIPTGGLSQTASGGITITSIERTAPLSARLNALMPTIKGGAKAALKGGIAGIIITEGLQQLLDGLGGFIDEAGNISRVGYPDEINPPAEGEYDERTTTNQRIKDRVPDTEIAVTEANNSYDFTCRKTFGGYSFIGWARPDSQPYCYYSGTDDPANPPSDPIPEPEIDNWIDNNFEPNEDDWPWLAPYMRPDTISLDPIPSIHEPPTTTTVYDANGNPHSIAETNIWHDFDIRNNDTSQPEVDMNTTEETKTYQDGNLTGTSTTTTTTPATEVPSSGGGGATVPMVEIPTDCDFHPTLCAWMNWTQEPPEEPEDNLSDLLKEVPIVSETFTITGGAAACPAPLVLNLSQFGSREVSYQPLCDLASTMRFLYLALMSFAAAILLHRSISRV